MTTAVESILASFDSLTGAERHEAGVEILRRVSREEGELPEQALVETADELFRALDDESALEGHDR
jgi:hypothetical protein